MQLDPEYELSLYRAHRFGITKLEDGTFALFTPEGEHILTGSISDLAPHILTGPDHYETCVDRCISRGLCIDTTEGHRLLERLNLTSKPTQPQPPLLRRI